MAENRFRDRFKYYLRRSGYRYQYELARALNVDHTSLSMWVNNPEKWSGGDLTRACELLDLNEYEKQELFFLAGLADPQEPSNLNEQSPFRIPLQRPIRRHHFMDDYRLRFFLDDLQPGQVVTLCGPGGIGKTALATEAIWALAPDNEPPDRFPDGIIFHDFSREPHVDIALKKIARAYGQDLQPTPLAAAQRVLAGRKVLLFLDAAENADDLQALLEVCGSCGVLMTSRKRNIASSIRYDVPYPHATSAVTLLSALSKKWVEDEHVAYILCEFTRFFPLTVYLIGEYMNHTRTTATEYLAWLRKAPLQALNFEESQHKSILTLFKKGLDQVSENARQVIKVVGLLDLAPLDPKLVATILEASMEKTEQLLEELVDYELLVRIGQRYEVSHTLVYTYARSSIKEVEVETLRRMVYDYYGEFEDDRQRMDAEIGHLESAAFFFRTGTLKVLQCID